MQKLDAPQLATSLNALSETFGKPSVPAKALEVWFDTLKEFHTEWVLGQLRSWPKLHGKFPVPSEVWKVLNERAIDEREERAKAEKAQRAREYANLGATEHGKHCLSVIYQMLAGTERPTPLEHWRKVLDTPGLPEISYEYARACLPRLEQREAA